MEKKSGNALMAFEDDIRKRGVVDWLIAHTSFAKPLHRYEGVITLLNDRILFEGKDMKAKQRYAIAIRREEVEEIAYGFDDIFRRGEDRALGISFQPLRIRIRRNGTISTAYLIMEYRRVLRTSNNGEWFRELKKWMDTVDN
jgi:hypothetical protein